MIDHIKTVVSRYKGKVSEWVVVNENFCCRSNDWWSQRLGQEYIEKAFIVAHETDPNVALILNDIGNEEINDVSNEMYEFVKGLKAKNIPITGIGMQMHLRADDPPDKENVLANMKRFGDLGVKVYVTEFDVDVSKVKVTQEEKYAIQAEIYKQMLEACLESQVCTSFNIFGFTDAESWYNYILNSGADGLIYDRSYKPKPSYEALKEVWSR